MKRLGRFLKYIFTGTIFLCLFLITPLIVTLSDRSIVMVILTWFIQSVIVIALILLKKKRTITWKWIIAVAIITLLFIPVISPRIQYILLRIFSLNKVEITQAKYIPKQGCIASFILDYTKVNTKEKIEFLSLNGITRAEKDDAAENKKIPLGLIPRLLHGIGNIMGIIPAIILNNLGKPEENYYTLRGVSEKTGDIWGLVPVNNQTAKVLHDNKYKKWVSRPNSSFPLYIIPTNNELKNRLRNSFTVENIKGTEQSLLDPYLLADSIFIDREDLVKYIKEKSLDHILIYCIAWIITIFIPAIVVSKKERA